MRPLSVVDPDPPRAGPIVDVEREGTLATSGALRDYWYVACLSRELGERPIRRTFFGVHVALYRDDDGRAHAVLDRCLHRGGALSAGVVRGGKLCCPYHGWTYDASGRCVHVPSLGPGQKGPVFGDETRSRHAVSPTPRDVGCLETFPVLEQDGLVFVLPGRDLARVRRPAFRVPYYDDPSWQTYWMITRFRNGVTHLVENFMDVPHTAFVHRHWFRSPTKRRIPARVEVTEDLRVVVTYQLEEDRIAGLGVALNPTGAPMAHIDEFIAPHVTRVDYRFGPRAGFMLNSHTTPIGPMDSIVYTAFCFRMPFDVMNVLGRLFNPILQAYTRHLIGQDAYMMDVQHRGLGARADLPRFAHTAADLQHVYVEEIRAWLVQGAEGPPPSPTTADVEMWL